MASPGRHWKPVLLDRNTLLGDQMESLYYWVTKYGYRGGFHDGNRQRQVLPPGRPTYPVTPPVGMPKSRTAYGFSGKPANPPKPARHNALRVLCSGKQACKPRYFAC